MQIQLAFLQAINNINFKDISCNATFIYINIHMQIKVASDLNKMYIRLTH